MRHFNDFSRFLDGRNQFLLNVAEEEDGSAWIQFWDHDRVRGLFHPGTKLNMTGSEEEKKTGNSSNNTTTAPPTAPTNTPPMMYYYQPFRPPVGYTPYPQGYPSYHGAYPVYPQMYMPPMAPVAPMPPMPHINHTPTVPLVNAYRPEYQPHVSPRPDVRPPHTQTRPPQTQAQIRPQRPPQTVAAKPVAIKTPSPYPSPVLSNYNLDDSEELEKWKAERRKRFPSSAKEKEAVADETVAVEVTNAEEEGALVEDDSTTSLINKKKRFCIYFSRGKCNKGDSCSFEHSKEQPAKRNKQTNDNNNNNAKTALNRPTIFENLLKIEEKELMLMFYECIKIILSQAPNKAT